MPTIPLPTRSTPLPNLPRPVLDREKRPTVDNRQVRTAVGELAESGKMPMISGDAIAAPYEALGSVGRAVAQTGNLIGALAIKRQEAITDTQVSDAEKAYLDERFKFEQQVGQPDSDPLKWVEMRQSGIESLRTSLFENKDLTPGAREQIGKLLDIRGKQDLISTQQAADSRIFRRAKDAYESRIENGIQSQNKEVVEGLYNEAISKGYMFDYEKEAGLRRYSDVGNRQQKQYKADEERAYFESNSAIALTKPEEFLSQHKGQPGKELIDERLKDMARSAINQRNAEGANNLDELIADGSITTPEEIEFVASGWKIPAELTNRAKKSLLQTEDFNAELDRRENASQYYSEMWQKWQEYDPASDPTKVKGFELLQETRQKVGGQDDGYLRSMGYAKMTGKPPEIKAPQQIRDLGTSIARDSLDSLKHNWMVPLKDNKGELVKDEKGKQKMVEDVGKKAPYLAEQASAMMRYDKFLRMNPNVDAQTAQKEMLKIIGEVGGVRKIQDVMKPPQASNNSQNLRSFVPADDLSDKLPTGLKSHAQDYIDAAREYGLNPRVLAAISALETGGGTSKAFREKRNAMGISDNSGPTEQKSVRDSIFHMARVLSSGNGPYSKAKTLDEVGAIYAPPGASNDIKGTNSGWAEGVRTWLARLS